MLDNLSPLKTPGCGTDRKYGTHETYVQPEERVRKLAAFHLSLFTFPLQCASVGFCGGLKFLIHIATATAARLGTTRPIRDLSDQACLQNCRANRVGWTVSKGGANVHSVPGN